MAEDLIQTINRISTPPADGAAFDEWLDATDGIDLLKENIQGDEFVFYATPGGTFIHSILVPAANVNPPDVEDLMRWSFNAYGTWGVSYTLTDSPRIWLDAPFINSGTKSFEGGSRLIFPRDFEGRVGNNHYWEILQPFAHVLASISWRSGMRTADWTKTGTSRPSCESRRYAADRVNVAARSSRSVERFWTNGCCSRTP